MRGRHLVIDRKWLQELEIAHLLGDDASLGKTIAVGVVDQGRRGAALESAFW